MILATTSFTSRNHFEAPRSDIDSFELKIEGAVLLFVCDQYGGVAEVARRDARWNTRVRGKRRRLPPPSGLKACSGSSARLHGAVGRCCWRGLAPSTVRARLFWRAPIREHPRHRQNLREKIRYARSIDLEKAKDTLIAYGMNGEDLTVDHGIPVRAVVLGHYGMASVNG